VCVRIFLESKSNQPSHRLFLVLRKKRESSKNAVCRHYGKCHARTIQFSVGAISYSLVVGKISHVQGGIKFREIERFSMPVTVFIL
jgi:hypothetical protein